MRKTASSALLAGLCLLAWPVSAQQPGSPGVASFDCADAAAPDEIAVCTTSALGALDIRMATTFEILSKLVAMGQRGDLQDAQRQFLAERKACGADVGCIRSAYEKRLGVLNAAVAALAARGPF